MGLSLLFEYCINMIIIGLTTFGGGAVFIPVMNKTFVEQMNVFSLEVFESIIALVNTTPGPTGPKIASYAGYEMFGVLGIFIMFICLILPSVIIMVIAYKSIEKLKNSKIMQNITKYIKPVVIGIFISLGSSFLMNYIDRSSFLNEKNISMVFIFIISFYLIDKKKVPPIFVILLGLTYGLINLIILK